jgi:type II secretory pathway pseudopilin PulG
MMWGKVLVFKPTSNRSRLFLEATAGFGLVELMISSGMLLLLMALIFALYFNGQRAWAKNSDHQDVMGNAQVSIAFLSDDLQSAPFGSVTIAADGSAISFLTMKNTDGQRTYTDEGRPLWDHWLVYYQSGDNLIRREVPWPESDPALREIPIRIEGYNGQTLDGFRDGEGRILTRRLEAFRVSNPSGTSLVHYAVSVKRKKNIGKILTLEGTIRPRN